MYWNILTMKLQALVIIQKIYINQGIQCIFFQYFNHSKTCISKIGLFNLQVKNSSSFSTWAHMNGCLLSQLSTPHLPLFLLSAHIHPLSLNSSLGLWFFLVGNKKLNIILWFNKLNIPRVTLIFCVCFFYICLPKLIKQMFHNGS